MIVVTTRAKETLAQLRAAETVDDPEVTIRLEADASGLGLVPDREKPGDHIVEHAGETVLLVDDRLADALTGATMDCKTTESGEQLVIATPEDNDGAEEPDVDRDGNEPSSGRAER